MVLCVAPEGYLVVPVLREEGHVLEVVEAAVLEVLQVVELEREGEHLEPEHPEEEGSARALRHPILVEQLEVLDHPGAFWAAH